MKAYLVVSGALFGLIGLAHGLRVFVEPASSGAFYVHNLGLCALGIGIAVWAWRLWPKTSA